MQSFATPPWNRVTPFALTRPDQFGPPALDRSRLPAQAKALVDLQASMSETGRTSSHYWADGPGSELPPGHWAMFAQAAVRANKLTLDQNVKGFFALGNALLDDGDLQGRALGARIGDAAWTKAQTYFAGTAG